MQLNPIKKNSVDIKPDYLMRQTKDQSLQDMKKLIEVPTLRQLTANTPWKPVVTFKPSQIYYNKFTPFNLTKLPLHGFKPIQNIQNPKQAPIQPFTVECIEDSQTSIVENHFDFKFPQSSLMKYVAGSVALLTPTVAQAANPHHHLQTQFPFVYFYVILGYFIGEVTFPQINKFLKSKIDADKGRESIKKMITILFLGLILGSSDKAFAQDMPAMFDNPGQYRLAQQDLGRTYDSLYDQKSNGSAFEVIFFLSSIAFLARVATIGDPNDDLIFPITKEFKEAMYKDPDFSKMNPIEQYEAIKKFRDQSERQNELMDRLYPKDDKEKQD